MSLLAGVALLAMLRIKAAASALLLHDQLIIDFLGALFDTVPAQRGWLVFRLLMVNSVTLVLSYQSRTRNVIEKA